MPDSATSSSTNQEKSASSRDKYLQCLSYTEDALEKLEVRKKTPVSKELLKFARDYFHDAKYYAQKKEFANALEAVAYAHGFIDAGVLAGFFNIKGYHLKEFKE